MKRDNDWHHMKWKVFLPDTNQNHESEVAVFDGDLLNLDNHSIKGSYTARLVLDRIHHIALEEGYVTTESLHDLCQYPENEALIPMVHNGKPLPSIVHLSRIIGALVYGDSLNLNHHTMLLALDTIHRIVLKDDVTTKSSYDMSLYPENVALISLFHSGKPLPSVVHLLMDKTKRKDFAVWLIVMLRRIDKHTVDWEDTIHKLQRISDSRMSIDFSDSKADSKNTLEPAGRLCAEHEQLRRCSEKEERRLQPQLNVQSKSLELFHDENKKNKSLKHQMDSLSKTGDSDTKRLLTMMDNKTKQFQRLDRKHRNKTKVCNVHIDAQDIEIEKLKSDKKELMDRVHFLQRNVEEMEKMVGGARLENENLKLGLGRLREAMKPKDREIERLKANFDQIEKINESLQYQKKQNEDLLKMIEDKNIEIEALRERHRDEQQTSIAVVHAIEREIRREMELQFKQEQRRSQKQNDDLEDEIKGLRAKLRANTEWKAKSIQILSRKNREFERTMDQEVGEIHRLQKQLLARMDSIQCDVNQMESVNEESREKKLIMKRVIAEKNNEINILKVDLRQVIDQQRMHWGKKIRDREYELLQVMENKERDWKAKEFQLKQQSEMEFKELKRKFEEIEKRVDETVLKNRDLKRESHRWTLLRMRQSSNVQNQLQRQNAFQTLNIEEVSGLMDDVKHSKNTNSKICTYQRSSCLY